MNTLNFDLAKPTVQKDIIAGLNENKFLLFVFRNFIENIGTILSDLHGSIQYLYFKEKEDCLKILSDDLREFILFSINETRKQISHGFISVTNTTSYTATANDLVNQFSKFIAMRESYLKPLKQKIKTIHFTPNLDLKISEQNQIRVSLSSSSSSSSYSSANQSTSAIPFAEAQNSGNNKKRSSELISENEDTGSSQKKPKSDTPAL